MNVLIIAPLPPPTTGNSLAVKVLIDELGSEYKVKIVNLSKPSFINGISSFSRFFDIIIIIFKVLIYQKKIDKIYFTISESKLGNIKDLLIYLACFFNLSKMIVHLHGGAGMRLLLNSEDSFWFKTNSFFLRRINRLVLLGNSLINIYSKVLPTSKIDIVPNFAEDFLYISTDDINKKFKNDLPLRVLFLSNLLPGKGHEELLSAYLSLSNEVREKIRIDFAGGFESNDQKKLFLEKIENLTGVTYHGLVYGVEKKKLFSSAHIFCLPTYYQYEGQPISILEAYASGCVVITTNHSGIRDVFEDDINGFEVQKRCVDSIKDLLINKLDSEKLKLIALFNREFSAEKYRTKIYIEKLKAILQRRN